MYGLFFKDLGSQFLSDKGCMDSPYLSVDLVLNSFVQIGLAWFLHSATLERALDFTFLMF